MHHGTTTLAHAACSYGLDQADSRRLVALGAAEGLVNAGVTFRIASAQRVADRLDTAVKLLPNARDRYIHRVQRGRFAEGIEAFFRRTRELLERSAGGRQAKHAFTFVERDAERLVVRLKYQ